jgi:hypothetical protein
VRYPRGSVFRIRRHPKTVGTRAVAIDKHTIKVRRVAPPPPGQEHERRPTTGKTWHDSGSVFVAGHWSGELTNRKVVKSFVANSRSAMWSPSQAV